MQYQAEGTTVTQGMDDMIWVGPHKSRRELGHRTHKTIKKIGKRDKKIYIFFVLMNSSLVLFFGRFSADTNKARDTPSLRQDVLCIKICLTKLK